MEITKKALLERLRLLSNLSHEAENLKKGILKDLPKKSMDPLCACVIEGIVNSGGKDLEKQFASLEKNGLLDCLPEGEDISFPAVKITGDGRFIDVDRPVDGGVLTAYSFVSDYGTCQTGLSYRTDDGIVTDIACAEVKRGELAKVNGYPEDNKDVDVYVWGDLYSEDFSEHFSISHDELESMSESNGETKK